MAFAQLTRAYGCPDETVEALERSRLPAEELKEVEKILLRWVTFSERTAAIFENDEKTQVAPLLRDSLPELVENTPNLDNYCQSAGWWNCVAISRWVRRGFMELLSLTTSATKGKRWLAECACWPQRRSAM